MDSTRPTVPDPPPWLAFEALEHACRTDVGMRRSHNQDAYAASPSRDRWKDVGHLFLVADGMGGHAVGEKAAAKAASDIPHTYGKHAHDGPAAALRRAFSEANAGIHAIGQGTPEFRGMGTTATALLLKPEGAYAGHVGDSRLYRVRGGQIEQLTFDHSALWEIARRQRVRPEDLHGIRSNVILRSLGPEGSVEVDVEGPHPVLPGDTFLLCSDGLSGTLTDSEIGAVASVLPPAEACDFLVELTNLRGGPDNITVMIVKAGDAPEVPAAPPRRRWLPMLPPWRLPWPVGVLLAGMAGAVLSIHLVTSELAGGKLVFGVAALTIAVGIVGLVMQTLNDDPDRASDATQPPRPRVYRQSDCAVDASLLDKLQKAEAMLKARLDESATEYDGPTFDAARRRADLAHGIGQMDSSFREHCRAMHVLLKSYNRQRHREESFAPVWDKHSRG